MTPEVVNLYEAKTRLSSLIEKAAAGDEIVIAKAGRPLARLVPYDGRKPLRFGSLEGKLSVPDDFDSLAQREIESMFYGRSKPRRKAAK